MNETTAPSQLKSPVLVTGADGLLGKAMVYRFQEEVDEVRAFLLHGQQRDPGWGDNVVVFEGDVREPESMVPATRDVGTIFHNVAVVGDWGPESWFHQVGVVGTEHLVNQALEQDARFLLASSITVSGDRLGHGMVDEATELGRAMGPYSRAKQTQERLVLEAHRQRGLRATVIRPGNIIGPGSQPWVHTCIEQLREKRPALIGTGATRPGLCYVDNVVEVFALAATNDRAIGQIYYALDGCAEKTWREYIHTLAHIAQTPPPKSIPRWLAIFAAATGEKLWTLFRAKNRPPLTREALNMVGNDLQFSMAKAEAELGFSAIADYDQAIAAIRDYVQDKDL